MTKKPGRPKKSEEIKNGEEKEAPQAKADVLEQSAPVPEKKERPRFIEKPPLSDAEHIAQSRKALEQPLEPHQKFFEAPDGEILIGDIDKDAVWSRRMNNGKGGWVNPRR